jgi:hypothetical protein
MFTKEILMDIFKKNENRNFQICTNIGVGRGINGIDFKSFIGDNYIDSERRRKGNTSSIKGFADTYLVIECARENEWGHYYCGAKKEVYVPYNNIVMVNFITDETHPLYGFTGKHNLNEI